MAAFSEIILTQRGQNLLAKAQAGTTLNFTRMAVGNGELNGQSMAGLNNLINQVKSLPISTLKTNANSTTVGTTWNNENISSGFYFREIGIFATDPQLGEILYAYGNAGALAEYIPPLATNLIERTTQIKLYIANVANITAVIDTSLVYATTSELMALEERVDDLELGLNRKVSTTTFNAHLGDIASQSAGKGASIVGINDSDSLFVSTNVEGALKEAMLEANSAKLLGNSRKQELVDLLLSLDNSLPISYSSAWEQILTAAENISTGKKWAEGTDTAPTQVGVDLIINLDFIPKYIYIRIAGNATTLLYYNGNNIYTYSNYVGLRGYNSGTEHLTSGSIVINGNSFSLKNLGNSSGTIGGTVMWLAIE